VSKFDCSCGKCPRKALPCTAIKIWSETKKETKCEGAFDEGSTFEQKCIHQHKNIKKGKQSAFLWYFSFLPTQSIVCNEEVAFSIRYYRQGH